MSSPTYSVLSNSDISRNCFKLSEQKFSSYVQALEWCKSNRYKYKYRYPSNPVDKEPLENKTKKYIIYGCDCHGVGCPNERKLEFHSTGQGTFEILMFERGLHSASSSVPKRRGIDTRLLEFIDYLCRQGKPSREIRCAVFRKAKAGQWGTIDDIVFPSEKQISNRKNYNSVKKSLLRIATERFQDSSSSITSIPEQTATTDDYVWSSDEFTPPILASTFTNLSSSAASNKDSSCIATERFQDNSSSINSIPEPTATTDDDYVWSSDELNTSPDSTLAFLTSYANATTDEARQNSTSKEQMKTQFDFNSIKEGFLAYNSTQRFEMILQLQMLNNLKSLNEQPHQRRLEEKPPPPKKQKLSITFTYPNTCIYDDDDEEEVTYRDP